MNEHSPDARQTLAIVRSSQTAEPGCCRRCENLVKKLKTGWLFDDPFNFGTVSRLQRYSSCTVCQSVLKLIRSQKIEWMRESEPITFFEEEEWWGVVSSCFSLKCGEDSLNGFVPVGSETWEGNHSWDGYQGVLLDPWIDHTILRSWLDHCDTYHTGSKCHVEQSADLNNKRSSMRLIDVSQKCLTHVTAPVKYFALSYVWGMHASNFETTLANVADLHRPGSLDFEIPSTGLPRTISDALQLVHNLGERYLWVDRFCIIQDDELNKTFHIRNMDKVYGNAYCTIIAASGSNGDAGLGGVKGPCSYARSLSQDVLNISGYQFLLRDDNYLSFLSSVWNRRGWTYQEWRLSRRHLIFSEDKVMWTCQTAERNEDLHLDLSIPVSAPHEIQEEVIVHQLPDSWLFPNFQNWFQFLRDYCEKDFTYASDFLDGFAGIESLLSKRFPAGFLKGLSEFNFDAALLWQPGSTLSRIDSSALEDTERYLPSWSWCGWSGLERKFKRFDFWDFCAFTSAAVRESPQMPVGALAPARIQWHIEPIVTWSRVDGAQAEHEIQNDYHQWRMRRGRPVSPPWREHQNQGELWYSHPALPGYTFWWPLPLIRNDERQPDPPKKSFSHLKCETKRALVIVGDTSHDWDRHSESAQYFPLHDSKNSIIGALCLDGGNNFKYGPMVIECIAISLGSALPDPDETFTVYRYMSQEWSTIESNSPKGALYEFYNVMWIERQDGFCYRKGIGRVHKPAWERLDLETVTVKLR